MDIEKEYKLIYKYIKFVVIDTWKNINPNVSWGCWINHSTDPLFVNDKRFYVSETSFLCGAFGYDEEFAFELVKLYYKNELNKIKNGKENGIITTILGV